MNRAVPNPVHRAQHLLLRGSESALSALGWERRVRLGRWIGRAWHAADARRRRLATDNVARAFPEWDAVRVRALVRANFEHLGTVLAEFAGLARTGPDELLDRFRFEGLDRLEAARAEGRGVLGLTAHLGNWEVGGMALAARVGNVCAVGRRIRNPAVDAWVAELRQRYGGRLIPHRGAVRPVLRALRGGALVGFLMDQRASSREAVRSEFFGRPVATNQGLALLALKTGAPVVPAFTVREGPGRHRVWFGPPVPPPGPGSRAERVVAFTRRFDAVTEAAVREHPEQWFWVHRRWRLHDGWQP